MAKGKSSKSTRKLIGVDALLAEERWRALDRRLAQAMLNNRVPFERWAMMSAWTAREAALLFDGQDPLRGKLEDGDAEMYFTVIERDLGERFTPVEAIRFAKQFSIITPIALRDYVAHHASAAQPDNSAPAKRFTRKLDAQIEENMLRRYAELRKNRVRDFEEQTAREFKVSKKTVHRYAKEAGLIKPGRASKTIPGRWSGLDARKK